MPATPNLAVSAPVLLALAMLLAGCAFGGDGLLCGYEAVPKAPPPQRAAAEVPQDVLARHPVLADLLSDPGLPQGLGASVACKEGLATMDDLARAGADVRATGDEEDLGRDTYVRVDGRDYHLNFAAAIRHG